jgi:hypothetical protein
MYSRGGHEAKTIATRRTALAFLRPVQKELGMKIIIIGRIGSDAGYTVIENGKVHHVGGWGVDQLAEFRSAVTIMGAATQLKTPGLAEAAIKSVEGLAQSQLAEHLKGGGVVVVLP